MLKIVITILIIYFVYKFITDFALPVAKASSQMRDKVQEMQRQMQQQQEQQQAAASRQQAQASQATPPSSTPQSATEKDYIDFEEIK